jgi:hypothetical protein
MEKLINEALGWCKQLERFFDERLNFGDPAEEHDKLMAVHRLLRHEGYVGDADT